MYLLVVIGIVGFIYKVIKESVDDSKAKVKAQKWAEGMHFETLAETHKRLASLTNLKENK